MAQAERDVKVGRERPARRRPQLSALLVEPPRPASIRSRPNAHWYVVATVCVGAFLGQLDASIVTLVMPTLRHQFHASLGAVEWVALAYLVVLVSTVTAVGRFADMVGRKLLYTYGFGVFTLASIACGLSPNLPLLIFFRVLQAIGAAMLQANSVALIATAVPRAKLGRAIGVQGAAQAIGLALGPTVGGLLITAGGWRWVFFVNAPAGIAGIVLGWFLLPRSRDLGARTHFDWLGLVLFAPAASALLLGMNLVARSGATRIASIPVFVFAVVCAIAFLRHSKRSAAPMLDLSLFRHPAFSRGIVAGLLSYGVLFGVLFVSPFFLEERHRLSPSGAGLVLTALPFTLTIAAPFAGRIADRRGPWLPTVSGMIITAAALVGLTFGHGTVALVLLGLAVAGVGIGAFTPANNASIMASAPRTQAGMAGGVLNMTRGLGSALGVAVAGLIFGLETAGRADVGAAATKGFTVVVAVLAIGAVIAAVAASGDKTPIE